MAELSKQALKVQNNTEFPNNNAGLITPTKLRGFNVDMIDSLVDEISYNVDSASWNQQIDSLENFTASLATNFVTTGSFNSYTQSTDNRLNNLESTSASVNISIANLNAYTASDDTSISNLEAFTASAAVSISNLNQSSASQQISIDALNSFSASQTIVDSAFAASITNLNSATASLFTSASLGLTTASFDNGNRNLTFSKGDGTQFSVNIPDVSGSAGNFVTTSSFNAYTQSNDQKVDSLIAATGSYATTGSNTFTGNQTITHSGGGTFTLLDDSGIGVNYGQTGIGNFEISQSGSVVFRGSGAGQFDVFASASFIAAPSIPNITSNLKVDGNFTASLQEGYVWVGNSSGVSTTVATSSFGGGGSVPAGTISGSAQITALGFVSSSVTGSSLVTASAAGADITFTKGDGSTFTITTATGSVASASYAETASLALTASIARNLIVIARNGGSSTLPAGTVVHITSAVGDNPIFTTASYDTEALSGNTFGLLRYSSLAGADVEVVVAGVVTGVDTDPAKGYTAGDIVYLSSSGQFTRVQPQAPNQIVTLGQVLRAQQNNGSIYVSINNGWELDELHNVQITSPQTGDIIQYESASYGLWKNKSLSAAGILTTSSFVNPSIETISGSVLITANGFTSGAVNLLHISASAQNQANLLFKNTNNAGSTIVSGSLNIYANGSAPAAGRLNYLENSNIFLNDSGFLPTVTASVLTAGGFYPRLRNNMWLGTGPWTINTNAFASSSVQAGSFNNNLFLGSTGTTLNTLGNTSGIAFSHNILAQASATINAPSRSLAQIAAGASGSNVVSFLNNAAFGGTITYNGPVSSSTHTISGNSVQGTATFNLQSGSRAYSISSNGINGTFTINDNTVFAPTLGSTNFYQNNIINGTATINNRFSSSFNVGNNNINTYTISSDADLSGISTAAQRTQQVSGNGLFGTLGNNIYFSGSAGGTTLKAFVSNLMAGNSLSASVIYTGGGEQCMLATTVLGHGLNVFGTATINAANPAGLGGKDGGSAFIGRYNATDGNRANTAETVFAVGTGNSGSAGIVRKTGFLIDSGSNTFIEGTLNVSGASSLNGNLIITGSLTASLQQGYVWVGNANGITTTVATSSFGGGGAAFPFTGNAVITGSLGISGSMFGGVISLSVVSSTASVDFSAGNMFTLTLPSASTHINPTNIRAGQTVNIQITQPTPGTGSVTFPSNVKFAGGNDYQATTTGSAIDMLTLVSYDGTNVLGTSIKNFL